MGFGIGAGAQGTVSVSYGVSYGIWIQFWDLGSVKGSLMGFEVSSGMWDQGQGTVSVSARGFMGSILGFGISYGVCSGI